MQTRFPADPTAAQHPRRRACRRIRSACGALLVAAACGSQASVIGGVEFPGGPSSFADAVIGYTPVLTGGQPPLPDRNPARALGVPDYDGVACTDAATCTSVSLGQGGSLTLEFVDNRLTGSGSDALDLWIFEVGPDVEDTYVAISRDGVTYFDVGKVFGATAGIDIDAFGFGLADEFRFVRLLDDRLEGGVSGADIDAVGAISSRRVGTLPVPATAWMACLALAFACRRARRSA